MTDTPTQSWFQQRWKWLVPVGCLGTLLLAIAWGVFIVFFVLAGAKSSDAYRDAVAAVESSPEALAALGSPIEIGWWMMGSIDVNGPSGDADLVFPVSGPEASGKLYVISEKRAGQWTMELLELDVEGRDDRVDLLTP